MKRGWIDYKLIYKIEGKYGSLANCPEEDEDLQELRSKLKGEKVVNKKKTWRDWKRQARETYG